MSFVHERQDYEGGVYSEYGSSMQPYWSRANQLDGIFGACRKKSVLVAGCGYGFLVQTLMERNGFVDAWGCDASEFAVSMASESLPHEYAKRIFIADARDLTRDYSVIVSEDLLPCSESEEEARGMALAMAERSRMVAHFITPVSYNTKQDPRFLWRSPERWKEIVGPFQVVISGGVVL